MKLGMVELESNTSLIIYGNAMLFLDSSHYYDMIEQITYESFHFDIITNEENFRKLKRFKKLNSLKFSNNNLHSNEQLLKIEELQEVQRISIYNNFILKKERLRLFLSYNFTKLKYFNETPITEEDVALSARLYAKQERYTNTEADINNGSRNFIEKEEIAATADNDEELLKKRKDNIAYLKDNICGILDEIIKEDL
jgi:hypothetical protein